MLLWSGCVHGVALNKKYLINQKSVFVYGYNELYSRMNIKSCILNMKNTKLFLLLISLSLVACGEYYGYDADDAESPYIPRQGEHMVKSLKTTSMYNGHEYSWEHNFRYDAQNRIEEVNSSMSFYAEDKWLGTYKGKRKSSAKYYYLENNIDVVYTVEFEYPDYPEKNAAHHGTDEGRFDPENGMLSKFSALDFVYSGKVLTNAYSDGGRRYEITRDRDNDVTGFKLWDDYTESLLVDKGDAYSYSQKKNNTNFDFSGYFGFWGVEEELVPNASPYYAAYQLAAFGFLGSTGKNLPIGKSVVSDTGEIIIGKWEFDEKGRPVLFTDSSGRKTVVSYVE